MTLTVQFIDLDTGNVQVLTNNYVQEVHPMFNAKTRDLVGFKVTIRNPETCRVKNVLLCAKPGCSLLTFNINCSN